MAEGFSNVVNLLKNPDFLLNCSRRYHIIEGRDVAYIASRRLIRLSESKIISSIPDVYTFVLAAKLIIYTWNAPWYLRLPREEKVKLESSLENVYKDSISLVERYSNISIIDINLKNKNVIDDIEKLYEKISQVAGITGASKILHILNPRLFPLWDYEIRRVYHKLHSKTAGRHKLGSSRCYLEFMRQMKEMVVELNDRIGEEVLWEKHSKDMPEQVRKTYQMFNIKEYLLKIIDECHYVIITRHEK